MLEVLTDKDYLLKYAFRFLHIAPVVALAGKIINDYLFDYDLAGASLNKSQKIFYAVSGVVLIVAGFVNTFLLKPKDKLREKAGLWIGFHHFKLLVALVLYTPILGMLASPQAVLTARFTGIVGFLVLSPLMRFYREYYTERNLRGEQLRQK